MPRTYILTLRVHTHVDDDPLLKETLLLCRHDKVVRVVSVVNNVLQVDAWKHEQMHLTEPPRSATGGRNYERQEQTDKLKQWTSCFNAEDAL